MYLGLVPMLSRGSFALYYGGHMVARELSEEVRGGSLVTPVFISGSVILQVVLSAFKLTQTSQLSPSANEGSLKLLSVRTGTWQYINNLLELSTFTR